MKFYRSYFDESKSHNSTPSTSVFLDIPLIILSSSARLPGILCSLFKLNNLEPLLLERRALLDPMLAHRQIVGAD